MEGRRRITLYDQMTAGNSTSLADLILNDNVVLTDQKSDDATADGGGGGGSCQLSQQSRTLIDILHEDEQQNNNNETTSDRKSKKSLNFMDKLRLKLTLNSKSNYNSNNNNNTDDNNYELSQQGNTHQQQEQQNEVVSAEPETAAEVSVAGPVVGVSLMDLLEETDVETVASNRMSDADFEIMNECDEGEEEEKGEEEEEGASVVERNCCVCMVRHKGAAFIPCGHTFCRACSREVWVSRGNCPLCNNFILEILDIF